MALLMEGGGSDRGLGAEGKAPPAAPPTPPFLTQSTIETFFEKMSWTSGHV